MPCGICFEGPEEDCFDVSCGDYDSKTGGDEMRTSDGGYESEIQSGRMMMTHFGGGSHG